MKTLKYILLSFLLGAATVVSAQVNLDDLSEAVGEDTENAAALVEQAVTEDPEQTNAIVARLLAEYPALAEQILLGAVTGMGDTATQAEVVAVVVAAVQFRPGLAPEILAGARRAPISPEVSQGINVAATNVLRNLGAFSGGGQSTGQNPVFDETLRISPSRS